MSANDFDCVQAYREPNADASPRERLYLVVKTDKYRRDGRENN
jgi:hypothetical protein